MAYSLPNLLPLLFLALSIFSYSSVAQTGGNVSVGASLTATDNAIPWLSPSQDFAFGFQKPNNNDLFLLSIWFYKIPDTTIVWYANEGKPVPRDSKVELSANLGLVLSDPQNNQLWSSDTAPNDVAYGFLNDTGNFVIVRSDSVKIWESFSNPTDTLLPTQIMEINGVLFSRQSETNFLRGRFQLRFVEDGNLMLNTREVATNLAYDAYYSSDTGNALNISNSGYRVIFAETGHIYILRRNDQRFNLTSLTIPPPRDYYYRATLNFDGVFSQYYYPKNSNTNQNWTSVLTLPGNICTDISADKGRGACGFNNVCTLDQYDRPVCECPPSFSLLDPSDKYGSCKPNFTICDAEDSINQAEDLYDFTELIDTDWPKSDYEQMSPYNEEDCKKSCLNDCFCAVAILRGNSCWKKKLPLSNGRRDRSVNGKAFIKFWKTGLPPKGSPRSGPEDFDPSTNKKNEEQRTLILVGSVLLGSSFLVNIVFVGNALNISNSGYRVIFAETGHIYILRRNDQRFNLTSLTIPLPRDYYYRATLIFYGVFSQYYYPKNSNTNQNWTSVLTLPGNICTDISADKGRGACGFNNVCTLDQYDRPVCECPPSFSLLDPSDKYGSCKPNFTICDAEDSINQAEDLYDFAELIDTDWPLSDYEQMSPYTEEDCKKSCLNDCFCAVAILRGNSCWKKKLPLSNGRRDRSVNGKAFIKFLKSSLPPGKKNADLICWT